MVSGIGEISSSVDEIRQRMNDTNAITINKSMLLTPAEGVSLMRKMEALTALTTLLPVFSRKLREITRKIQVRNQQMRTSRSLGIFLNCYNRPQLTWEEALSALSDSALAERRLGPLTVTSLCACADLLQSCNAIPVEEILHLVDCASTEDWSFCQSITDQLLKWFPVFSVTRIPDKQCILVNMHEFSMLAKGNTFADMFALVESKDITSDERQLPQSHTSSEQVIGHSELSVVMPSGRKPYHEIYPKLVTFVTEFIRLHGFSAEARRRSTTGNLMGVSLADIRDHVQEKIPELKKCGISRSTIHHLLCPPRKITVSSNRYKGLVDARVPGKSNTIRTAHVDGHFCFS